MIDRSDFLYNNNYRKAGGDTNELNMCSSINDLSTVEFKKFCNRGIIL